MCKIKSALLIIFTASILFGCVQKSTLTSSEEVRVPDSPNQAEKSSKPDAKKQVKQAKQAKIFVKDSAQYDPNFIAQLVELHQNFQGEPLSLIDNLILIGTDTVYLPGELPLNQMRWFKGSKNGIDFSLSLKRVNQTNLSYTLKRTGQAGKLIDSKQGTAILNAGIILASEIDEDERGGEGYSSFEYWDKADHCEFSIRIGERDQNGKFRIKITMNCPGDTSRNINLEDSPTLR